MAGGSSDDILLPPRLVIKIFIIYILYYIGVFGTSETRSYMIKKTLSDVDGHLRLRTPYPVRSVKLSSLKLG